jgi:bifunctional enzyme CysN/CysC
MATPVSSNQAVKPVASTPAEPPRTLEQFLAQQREIDLLRFITCGSVDDGKSTLIGRLLHDTRQVFDDQLSAVANDSRRWGTTGEVPDLALLVDGLQAEREQGITIDVAYRYFQTPRRKFIVADCPGHEQYTRNMATGASTADAAVVLVDAEKGVRVQTRRHTHIVSLLGVQNVILAVNKMDRINFDKARFEAIAGEFVAYARKLGVQNVEVIPVAALVGLNVVARGAQTPWYTGRTLLEALEGIEAGRTELLKDLRFPIQLVSRPDANFRGYAGTIASGEIAVGDAVLALPSRKSSKVREITTADGPLEKAGTHQAVTIVLEDEIDLSRGDVLVHPDHRPTLARTFDANLIWMGEAPLLPGKRYEFKIGSRYVKGLVDSIQHRIDVNDLSTRSAEALDLNGLARVRIALEEPVAVDDYKLSRATGSFIIIDLLHFGTVGAGMVIAPTSQAGRSTDVVWQPTRVTASIRANQKSQRPAVVWFTGLSGSGKSTVANALEQALVQRGHHSYLLDGDNVRHGLNKDLDFSDGGRAENIRRIGEVSALFVDAGLLVITAFISPFRADRDRIRTRIGDAQFIEVYLSTSLEECERRDPKGLYVKARAGEIREFTGIDSPYEPPIAPQITIDTSKQEIGATVDQILKYLENKGFLHQADPGL